MQEAEKIWMNGALVDWPDAQVHVLSHGLHYGTTVFEGIRSYDADKGTAVFRLDDHLARLERSAAMYHMPIPYSREELRAAVHQVISSNDLGGCYIRPIVAARLRHHGAVPAGGPGRRGHRRVAVGRLPGRGRPAHRHPRQDLQLAPHRVDHDPRHGQGRRPVPQLDPREDREPQGRLPGGPAAQRGRLRGRRLGREPVPGARRGAHHAAGPGLDPRGDHARQHHHAGPRRGHPGARARGRARRALHGRRGVHHGHRGRGLPDQRGRRPRPGRARARSPSACSRASSPPPRAATRFSDQWLDYVGATAPTLSP